MYTVLCFKHVQRSNDRQGRLAQGERLLVVSFGSAPGLPNWGGLLKKVYNSMTQPALRHFDTLYVVDPTRSWYYGEPLTPEPRVPLLALADLPDGPSVLTNLVSSSPNPQPCVEHPHVPTAFSLTTLVSAGRSFKC